MDGADRHRGRVSQGAKAEQVLRAHLTQKAWRLRWEHAA
jgi:hypothetical protein